MQSGITHERPEFYRFFISSDKPNDPDSRGEQPFKEYSRKSYHYQAKSRSLSTLWDQIDALNREYEKREGAGVILIPGIKRDLKASSLKLGYRHRIGYTLDGRALFVSRIWG